MLLFQGPRPARRRAGAALASAAGIAVVAASIGLLVLPGIAQTGRPAAPDPVATPPSVNLQGDGVLRLRTNGGEPVPAPQLPQRLELPPSATEAQVAPPATSAPVPASVAAPVQDETQGQRQPAAPAAASPTPPEATAAAGGSDQPAAAAEAARRLTPPMPVPRPEAAPSRAAPAPEAAGTAPAAEPETLAAAPARPPGGLLPQPPVPADPTPAAASGCLPFETFAASDRDGDVARNAAALRTPGLCLEVERFTEGRLSWTLQIVSHQPRRAGPLWAVPHDNEHAAFTTAVAALLRYGGVIVAVETGGSRFNGPQDPNRNFNEGGARCPQQVGPSAEYTRRFLGRRSAGQPIIALHTNDPGIGNGTVSIASPTAGSIPFRRVAAPTAPAGSASDDTLVFVASTRRPDQDADLAAIVSTLRARGLNVMYEVVTAARNDCSMSNWAALRQVNDYFNVEVVHGASGTQSALVDIVMRVIRGDRAIAPPPEPAAAAPPAGPFRATRPLPAAAPARAPGTDGDPLSDRHITGN